MSEPLVRYVSDAVAFFYYLLDRLPRNAELAFRRVEEGGAVLYLPTIAAAELHYLFERKGWRRHWSRLRTEMRRHPSFRYSSFDEGILGLFEKTKAREIHDRIIVSTATNLRAEALITKDKAIRKLAEVKTIW